MMLQVRAFKQLHRGHGVSIFIEDTYTGGIAVAEPIVLKKIEEHFAEIEPSVILPQESAQKLIDDLWDAGLRPSEGSGSAGAFKAVQDHLRDMRKIAFKHLKLEE